MADWWISTKRFTCWFRTDEQEIIVDSAPYLWRRRGTAMKKFIADLVYYRLVRLGATNAK